MEITGEVADPTKNTSNVCVLPVSVLSDTAAADLQLVGARLCVEVLFSYSLDYFENNYS